MVKSVYIHIPFCRSKCHYCSFVSFERSDLKKDYLESLKKEILNFYENEPLSTIYFGGGTPSMLDACEFANILNLLNFTESTEVTTELNPEGISYDYLRALSDFGINRLSFGCQTFNDDILKLINRRHNSEQVEKVIDFAQKAGFKNISLDFIYGLPSQTPQMFYDDLKRGADLGVQHISLYGLKIEDGCYFSKNVPENLPDDDMHADMYLGAIELLKNCGFEHYEVSNFSKPWFNSRHNLTYWKNEEYYGFGVAAHGYKRGVRYGNKENLEDYIKNPTIRNEEHILTTQEKLEEEIFLGFRIMSGVDIDYINNKYNIDFVQKYCEILNKYEDLKLLQKTNKGYALTNQGILLSNVVLADFVETSTVD